MRAATDCALIARTRSTSRQLSGLTEPLSDLPGVMPSMHPMKFSPFVRRQGTEERVIHNLGFHTKFAFAVAKA
jgi:hypothetical protein